MEDEAEQLHLDAFRALRGVFSTAEGEKVIATLLRSSVDLDPIMREMLAQAIAPIGKQCSEVRLRLTNLDEGKIVRAILTKRTMLKRGNSALLAMKEGQNWEQALSATAEKYGCSRESVEKGYTYARRYAEWCENFEGERHEANAGYSAWCSTFHSAAVRNIDPAKHWEEIHENLNHRLEQP